MIRLALAAPSVMLLAGLEALVARDGAVTIVERVHPIDGLGEALEGADVDVVVAVVDTGLSVVPVASALALARASARSAQRYTSAVATTPLSPREREILALLAEGMGNKIVAARLGISEHTVKTHVASVFHKLGADTRAEAVAIGARSGLILL